MSVSACTHLDITFPLEEITYSFDEIYPIVLV